MNSRTLTIGSRGSDLALYQANFIKSVLVSDHNCQVDIKIIRTSGDKIDNVAFDKMEGKGFFTKELEEALLNQEIDLAVHSLKDLMTTQPAGLKLGAAGYRADRREMLLINRDMVSRNGLIPVKEGRTIGTSSARRKCQIAAANPTLVIADLRGNVPTRVRKLREGQYDAIVIAAAGVTRLELDLSDLEVVLLDAEEFLPAPAQGILGIQIRDNDPRVEAIVSKLGSDHDMIEAQLERGLLARFGAGCSLPLGVVSRVEDDAMSLHAVLGIRDGEGWAGLEEIEVEGSDVNAIVDKAFTYLSGKVSSCA